MQQHEIYEVAGYLTNPHTDIKYDVQVPPTKREEFELNYRELTAALPCRPGTGGYSVLGAHVDKYSVQYRFSYCPVGNVPVALRSISRDMSGNLNRKRVSNKKLLLALFGIGFKLGAFPDRRRVISRIPPGGIIRFEFGYVSASCYDELAPDKFEKGFSAVVAPQSKFLLQDRENTRLETSVRVGRSAAFRNHVLCAYQSQCCVCSNSLLDLSGIFETEAAHIVPKRVSGADDVRNGLALCRQHHWAFDRGMFGINSEYRIMVPPLIRAIKENASLSAHNGNSIVCPGDSTLAPHPSALQWHAQHILCRQ